MRSMAKPLTATKFMMMLGETEAKEVCEEKGTGDKDLVIFVLCALVFMIGLLMGFGVGLLYMRSEGRERLSFPLLAEERGRVEDLPAKSVAVQGPVTYTSLRNCANPRFLPLTNDKTGVWPG